MLVKNRTFTLVFILSSAYLLLTFCGRKQDQVEGQKKDVLTEHTSGEAAKVTEPAIQYNFDYDTMIIGGQNYRTLHLDGKRWMIDNLNYETPDSWCYNEETANCQQYGRLYTWESAVKACAAVGWRLPTDQEWSDLATPFQQQQNGNNVAYEALLKGGESGFEAILGGFRFDYGAFDFLNGHGYYWSGTEQDNVHAWGYDLFIDYERLFRIALYKSYGYSCRCVKED